MVNPNFDRAEKQAGETENVGWLTSPPTQQRRTDIQIELALYNYKYQHSLEDLPPDLKHKITTVFKSYKEACSAAREMVWQLQQPGILVTLCQNSPVGKHLPEALYIHNSALPALDPLLRLYEKIANAAAGKVETATLIKFQTDKPKISYLFYPDFDTDPHPTLSASISVGMDDLQVTCRDYTDNNNPPVLHRKETFVTPDYPLYLEFAELTRQEEALSLLNNSRKIGTKIGWQQQLDFHRVAFSGHYLICAADRNLTPTASEYLVLRIERHKAAMNRTALSRPVRTAIEADLFTPETTFFDYGCGYGGDVTRMKERGYTSAGWDPYYSPDTPQESADIVNIGYVINVIEDTAERREALEKAWQLTQQVLIVAAQVLIDHKIRGWVAYGDGIITSRNTFQKYYSQEELKTYIDQVLAVDSVPAGLGIYFVFRDEVVAESFRASRFRSRATTPQIKASFKRFEDYKELLTPLMEFVTERGRMPVSGELFSEAELKAEFGNYRRAFNVILQATDILEWNAISEKRRQDLLVYLALSRFTKRPRSVELAATVKEDIKGLFGSYKQACLEADKMLFSLRDINTIAQLCQTSTVGIKTPKSLLIHISALELLNPLLRVYEGCASSTTGRLEPVNVIKIHTKKAKISYLYYPNFDTEAHPVLQTRMQVDLINLHVHYQDWEITDNPPVLHQKDALVAPNYPLYEKFARLSQQEIKWGLLDDWQAISNLRGWLKCLQEHCATITGHRLQWQKDADPYKIKILQSAIRNRQNQQKIQPQQPEENS